MPIPDLSNKPGPGRPGWGPAGAYEFKLEFQGPGDFSYNGSRADGSTSYSLDLGDGTTYSSLGAGSITHTFGAGTFTILINSEEDSGPLDTFQITGTQANKNKVTKILSWGKIPWRNLNTAFQTCQGLTKIDGGILIGGVNCNLNNAFKNCIGLTEAICKNWDLSSGCSTYSLFESCTNLELLDLTGAKFAVTAASNFSFYTVGTNVSSGCDFKMANLNLTGTTNSTAGMQWFQSSKFKDGSNLSNWIFPSALNSVRGDGMFDLSIINGTLDLSNWTWPNQTFPSFNSVNSALTSQNGSKIKLSNWDLSAVNNFAAAFISCKVYELEGLSTWNACAGGGSAFRMFSSAVLMRINPSDNFSNAFMASLTPIYVNQMFMNFSRDLLDAERGPCPNLNGLNLSNLTVPTVNGLIDFMNNSHFTNTPDFSNVTFSSTNTVNFLRAFNQFDTIGTGSDSIFNFNPITVKPANFQSTFYWAHGLSEVNIGSNVDMSSAVDFNDMFRLINYSTAASTFTNVTFPTNADFSSLTSLSRTFEDFSGNPIMSVCQTDNFIRRSKATNNNSNLTVNFYANKVTEAPSVVRSDVDYLENTKGWNITLATPDATLPFSYPSYAFDPSSTTSATPNLIPSGAVFSTTTSGVTINATTGVATWPSTFTGNINIKCTYTDGCYNEVVILVQVPFTMRTTIPANGSNFTLSPQMSNGECFVDWGDTNSQTLTASTTHNYTSSGTYDIKIFDSVNGSKFTGFSSPWTTPTYTYEKSILKWGDIEWQNNNWFYSSGSNNTDNKIRVEAPAGSSNAPNLSNVTSLSDMFSSTFTANRTGYFEDVNGNLSDWDVSTITDMNRMFKTFDANGCTIDIRNWNVSNVENFSKWGENSSIIFNIDNWVTSSATNMSQMCNGVSSTSTGIENLVTTNVTTLYQFGYVTFDGNTKMVNNVLRWDVSNCTNFSAMGCNWATNSNFPSNWKLSDDASKNISMQQFCGIGALTAPYGVDDVNAFATKTINQSWHGGSSYVAWDVSNVTNFYLFGGQNNNVVQGGEFPNWNIGTWNITSKTTNMLNMFATGQWRGSIPNYFDQDLSGWDISGITSLNLINGATSRDRHRMNMSVSNYDATLIGWGAHAANAQSGVTVNFGNSNYTGGGTAEAGRTALVNAGWTIIDGGGVYSNTNALSFNGSSEYISIGRPSNLILTPGTDDITISAYFKTGASGCIFSFDAPSTPSQTRIKLGIEGNDGKIEATLNGNSSGQIPSGSDSYNDDDWYHVALTCAAGASTATIYINGSSVGTVDIGPGNSINTTEGGAIGARTPSSPGFYFNGILDEIMVWNTVISTGDIQAYANVIGSGSIPDPNSITGLQMWNRMGD